MTLDDLYGHFSFNQICLYIVSIHRNFYTNRFINEYARKNFFVRYRRTYVLKNKPNIT